jgi:hypothetical protein
VTTEHAKVLDCEVILADYNAPLLSVVSGRLVLMAVCITEDERMKTDPKNSWIRWDYSDGEQRTHINLVNKTFIYALLGDTGLTPRGANSVALVLAPAGNEIS